MELVRIISEAGETEFVVPKSKMELVRALLWEVSEGASNTPSEPIRSP